MSLQSIEFLPDQPILHTLPPYGISARFFCNMYEGFGLESTEPLKQFTYGVCDLSRIVDDAIDKPEIATPATFDELITRMQEGNDVGATESDTAVALMYTESLTGGQLEFANEVYQDALQVADIRTSAKDINEYIQSVELEAKVQCRALAVSEASNYSDLAGRKRYNAWLKHFTLAGYLIDSALDMPIDYSEGRISLPPTSASRLAILSHALKPSRLAARRTPRRALPLLGGLALSYHVPLINKGFSNSEDVKVPLSAMTC